MVTTAGCGSPPGASDAASPASSASSSSSSSSSESAEGSAQRSGSAEPEEEGASATPSIPERLVDDAEWVDRDGTRALKVTPNERLRGEADQDVVKEAWRRVVRAVPDAEGEGMRDQVRCHAVFASDKAAWYLEPARPEVGWWETVAAGCNPGNVVDVG